MLNFLLLFCLQDDPDRRGFSPVGPVHILRSVQALCLDDQPDQYNAQQVDAGRGKGARNSIQTRAGAAWNHKSTGETKDSPMVVLIFKVRKVVPSPISNGLIETLKLTALFL